jgi:hypothetical protein
MQSLNQTARPVDPRLYLGESCVIEALSAQFLRLGGGLKVEEIARVLAAAPLRQVLGLAAGTSSDCGSAIVLEPVPESWEWLDALVAEVDDDVVSAVRKQPEATERPELDKVFR